MNISPHLHRIEDTCHVYVVHSGDEAVTIDFGAGRVLDKLGALGAARLTDVLMTHHHRDQGQGLPRAIDVGARLWVPHTEQDLFHSVGIHWQARAVMNDYNMRQDRFSLAEPVPVAGTLRDYARYPFGDTTFTVVPTPGHTTGSVTLLAEIDGQRVAFVGDLIAAPGKVWSLAATQWTYNGGEGLAGTILSLLDLKERRPDLLLPSHGEPMDDPEGAIDLLVDRLWDLVQQRGHNPRLFQLRQRPYEAITPHLLGNRTSMANAYVLLSQSGKALCIDFGYDFMFGIPAGTDRASRRPWLYTLPALKEQFGVTEIDVVLPTHFHDDHVAGINLLRDVTGAQVWAAETFTPVLEHPTRYDLPCLWYDPIPVDRTLPLEQPIPWEEYEFTLHHLPGHTHYAVAVSFAVDGQRVLATGDQYQGGDGLGWNYVYHNGFAIDDYRASAALYRRLRPDLILSGHWDPLWVAPGYFDALDERGEALARLHRDLLPPEVLSVGAEGFAATIRPYQSSIRGGETAQFEVEIRNPLEHAAEALVRLGTPPGWKAEPDVHKTQIDIGESQAISFSVTPPTGTQMRRARITADLVVGGRHLGQQAEALVDVM